MLFDSSFLLRIAVSGAVALFGIVLYYLNFLTFPKDFFSLDKEITVLLTKKTGHWRNTCLIVGFLALTGDPNNMQEVWTLPLFLRSCLIQLGEMGLELVLLYSFPFVAVLIYRSINFGRGFGLYAVRYVWLRYIMYTGFGMLICQGFEFLARLIRLANPKSGSILYFAFGALVLLQIAYVGLNMCYFVIGYILSFFSEETIEQMSHQSTRNAIDFVNKRIKNSGNDSFSSSSTSSDGFDFPDSLNIGGESYRIEHSDSEKASYYCSRTGARTTVRMEDLDT